MMEKINRTFYLESKTENQLDLDYQPLSLSQFKKWQRILSAILLAVFLISILSYFMNFHPEISSQLMFYSGIALFAIIPMSLYFRINRRLLFSYADNEEYVTIQKMNWEKFNNMKASKQHALLKGLFEFEKEVSDKMVRSNAVMMFFLIFVYAPLILFDSFDLEKALYYAGSGILFIIVFVYILRYHRRKLYNKKIEKLEEFK